MVRPHFVKKTRNRAKTSFIGGNRDIDTFWLSWQFPHPQKRWATSIGVSHHSNMSRLKSSAETFDLKQINGYERHVRQWVVNLMVDNRAVCLISHTNQRQMGLHSTFTSHGFSPQKNQPTLKRTLNVATIDNFDEFGMRVQSLHIKLMRTISVS